MRDQRIQISWNLCTEPHRKEIIHVPSCPNSTLDYWAMKRLISKISTLTIKSKPTLHFMFSWLFREKYVTTNFWKICYTKLKLWFHGKILKWERISKNITLWSHARVARKSFDKKFVKTIFHVIFITKLLCS